MRKRKHVHAPYLVKARGKLLIVSGGGFQRKEKLSKRGTSGVIDLVPWRGIEPPTFPLGGERSDPPELPRQMVEPRRIELPTLAMRMPRSPKLSYGPNN